MRTAMGRSVSVVMAFAALSALGCGGDADSNVTTRSSAAGAGGASTGKGGAGATGGAGMTTGRGGTGGTGGGAGGATGGSGASGGSGGTGAKGGAGGAGGTTGGAGGADGGTIDAGGSDAGGGATFDIPIGPVTLAPGEERVVCIDKKIPANRPVDVVKIASELTKGGHHLVFYKSSATVENTTAFPCQSFRDILIGTVPLFIAQKPVSELNFPPGVAYTMPPNQMVRVELHFLNSSSAPLPITGVVRLSEAKAGTITEHANLMFYGNVGIFLPPNAPSTVGPTFRAVPAGRKVFGITGHQHHLGTGFTIELAQDALTPGTPIYKNLDWADPPLTIFNPPLAPAAGQGFRYICNYNNTTPNIVTFGEGVNQEMCFLWAYYYPDQGFDIGF